MSDCDIMTKILNCRRDVKERKHCDRELCPVANGFDCLFWLKQQLVWANEAKGNASRVLQTTMNHDTLDSILDGSLTDA
jgi:hypothetical protein